MSSSTNKALVKSFVEDVFNKHDLSAIEKYFGKDSTQDSPLVGNGCEGFKQFLSAFFTAFPDMHTNIEHIVIENIPWFDPGRHHYFSLKSVIKIVWITIYIIDRRSTLF